MAIPVIDQTLPLDLTNVQVCFDSYGRKMGRCVGCGGWVMLDGYLAMREVFRQIIHRTPCPTVEQVLHDSFQNGLKTVPENWTDIAELMKK